MLFYEIVLIATIAAGFVALTYQGQSYARELESGISEILNVAIKVDVGWSSALLIMPYVREIVFRERILFLVDSPLTVVTPDQKVQLLRLIDRVVKGTD